MSTLGKWVAKIFMVLLIVVFACIIVNWLVCSKRPDISDILAFIPDIDPPDEPTALIIKKGSVPIPKDSLLIYNPTIDPDGLSFLPDTIYLPVEVVVIEGADTTLVSAKVAGVPVQLKGVTYIRQTSPWQRWRFCLSAIPYDRPDFSVGVAYQVFRWRTWWMGVALAADVPDFSWAGIGVRAGWYVLSRTSLDAELGYSTDGQIYGQAGISFRF